MGIQAYVPVRVLILEPWDISIVCFKFSLSSLRCHKQKKWKGTWWTWNWRTLIDRWEQLRGTGEHWEVHMHLVNICVPLHFVFLSLLLPFAVCWVPPLGSKSFSKLYFHKHIHTDLSASHKLLLQIREQQVPSLLFIHCTTPPSSQPPNNTTIFLL